MLNSVHALCCVGSWGCLPAWLLFHTAEKLPNLAQNALAKIVWWGHCFNESVMGLLWIVPKTKQPVSGRYFGWTFGQILYKGFWEVNRQRIQQLHSGKVNDQDWLLFNLFPRQMGWKRKGKDGTALFYSWKLPYWQATVVWILRIFFFLNASPNYILWFPDLKFFSSHLQFE